MRFICYFSSRSLPELINRAYSRFSFISTLCVRIYQRRLTTYWVVLLDQFDSESLLFKWEIVTLTDYYFSTLLSFSGLVVEKFILLQYIAFKNLLVMVHLYVCTSTSTICIRLKLFHIAKLINFQVEDQLLHVCFIILISYVKTDLYCLDCFHSTLR